MEQPVTCDTCGTQVLVEKYSWHHTNIQWTTPSVEVCPRVREQVARGIPPSRALTCEDLRASVERATVEGSIEVLDPS